MGSRNDPHFDTYFTEDLAKLSVLPRRNDRGLASKSWGLFFGDFLVQRRLFGGVWESPKNVRRGASKIAVLGAELHFGRGSLEGPARGSRARGADRKCTNPSVKNRGLCIFDVIFLKNSVFARVFFFGGASS